MLLRLLHHRFRLLPGLFLLILPSLRSSPAYQPDGWVRRRRAQPGPLRSLPVLNWQRPGQHPFPVVESPVPPSARPLFAYSQGRWIFSCLSADRLRATAACATSTSGRIRFFGGSGMRHWLFGLFPVFLCYVFGRMARLCLYRRSLLFLYGYGLRMTRRGWDGLLRMRPFKGEGCRSDILFPCLPSPVQPHRLLLPGAISRQRSWARRDVSERPLPAGGTKAAPLACRVASITLREYTSEITRQDTTRTQASSARPRTALRENLEAKVFSLS